MHSAYKLNKQDDNIQPWCTPFPIWNQSVVPCPVNCCFLPCIQVSQEAGQVVWYSHLLKNFPQFIVIHTVQGFGIVNKAEIDVFLELSCFFYDPADVSNLISGSSAFSKSSLNIWKFTVHILSITPSKSMHVVANGKISFLLWLSDISLCTCTTSSVSIHLLMDP